VNIIEIYSSSCSALTTDGTGDIATADELGDTTTSSTACTAEEEDTASWTRMDAEDSDTTETDAVASST
jgi:hypothetical protein